ncbi:ArsR/SmtB family transcription factor [Streptomyces sp. NBC_01264]|uniref:ArsR/SmtB family transcription factor n=1 Tax=Streptomyces sp. NBC_01264 TaxID=2903804 RepID=UPI00225B7999|nr:helix-turn-helix domain-containing protein [Streptomyces sp. NBC_01264]MCX4778673.1 helix-turn-helix domain-containing protein [Streptomyces sp. NBC_01264]
MPETPDPESADPRKPAEPTVRKLDPHSLRGLAHPLRIRLLGDLRLHGPATASQLAERLGESSGSTSYHLRQLAAHGFVEDAPEHGKGRERWWRPSQDGTSFDEELIYDSDPATRGAAEVFLSEIVKIHAQELSTWMSGAADWPAEWRRASDLSDFSLQLTPDQSLELVRKMHDLINSYSDLPPSEGTETVRFHTHAFPRRIK